MRPRTRLIRLLVAGAGLAALAVPPSGLAAEPTTTQGTPTPAPAPAETTSTNPPPQTSTSEPSTLTVEPAPPPRPAPSRTPGFATTPQVRAQHAQGGTRGAPSPPTPRAKARGTQGPSSGSAVKRTGPRAPSPSALTPPLPLAFSASLAGVPTFFIESFRIPPFLLPLYQAAGTAYGVPWQVLAAINEVETDYGRDLSVSSAGAEGWMQFLPSSWAIYAVDANGDGFRDPYNPADAIFAAARYLRAAGAATNLRGAIFAYNHSLAYVESVMLRARLLGGTPTELLGAITGLTQARFPVHAPSHFSDGFAAAPAGSGPPRMIAGTTIYSQPGAPVIAVQDGRIAQIGDSRELGRFISLRDAYGNTYTYAQLGRVARLYPVLKPHEGASAGPPTSSREASEPHPSGPASAGTQARAPAPVIEGAAISGLPLPAAPGAGSPAASGSSAGASSPPAPAAGAAAPPSAAPAAPSPGSRTVFRAGPNDVYLHPLRRGASVIAGTVLGHVGGGDAHMLFQIRPAGPGAPLIDPKPILDGWVQLENSSIFRARGSNPYLAATPTAGQVLLESKQQLEQQVLANRAIAIYRCGRQDIQSGQIDRRVLATLEFLAVSGLKPTVSGLRCGHVDSRSAASRAEQASGDGVDISQINGIPIAGHQGPGSIANTTVRKLLSMQGTLKPQQIVSLVRYPGTDNTLAAPDHANHIHVGFRPPFTPGAHLAGVFSSAITPDGWIRLIARLGEIPNPTVRSGPSAASIPDNPAPAGTGEAGGHG